MALDSATKDRISSLIQSDDVVLFMKGNRGAPRCGFSAALVSILDGLVPDYTTVDVLADPAIREGIKEYSEWPTIPQLYVKGEFLGGSDTAKEMFASGELQAKLSGVQGRSASAPTSSAVPASVQVTLTPSAARVLADARDGQPDDRKTLRLSVNGRFKHQLSFGPRMEGDAECASEGITILVDKASIARANGVRIDATVAGAFQIDNPNEPASVKQLSVTELKAKLDAGTPMKLYDVRTPSERATAKIDAAVHLDDAARAELDALDKSTPLYFHCHHGGRSQAAAEHYLQKGFRQVFNIVGGIDAWSREVDANVPRY